MKKIIYVLIAGIMAFALAACGSGGSSENEGAQENTQGSSAGGNSLVVYFSATGNTESVAETLAQMQGAEKIRIQMKIWITTTAQAEQRRNRTMKRQDRQYRER